MVYGGGGSDGVSTGLVDERRFQVRGSRQFFRAGSGDEGGVAVVLGQLFGVVDRDGGVGNDGGVGSGRENAGGGSCSDAMRAVRERSSLLGEVGTIGTGDERSK